MAESTYHFDATQANFEREVIQASLDAPVLVDFWAAWCAPLPPAQAHPGKACRRIRRRVPLAKVDTQPKYEIAQIFGIRSLPTVVLFKDGQMIDGFMGADEISSSSSVAAAAKVNPTSDR